MANRNENLKKINAELEKLTDEQLEQIAGGVPWRRDFDFVPNAQETQNDEPNLTIRKPGIRG